MNTLDSMLERNKDFAAEQSAAGTLASAAQSLGIREVFPMPERMSYQ
jgi:hypothetical protein